MFIFNLWNNLSIRTKIWGLVLLPTIVIISLASRQVLIVNNQLTSLEKATQVVDTLELLDELNSNAYKVQLSSENKKNTFIENLNIKFSTFLSVNRQIKFQQLLNEYQETIDAITTSEDSESRYDNTQWQADVYKQLLLTLEKTNFESPIPTIDNHLKALFQLEWLVYWAQEENRQSNLLVHSTTESNDMTALMRSDIRTLIQNQQLFVDRFIAMNANTKQVTLLLTAFSNIAFENSNIYREQLLDNNLIKIITPFEISQGKKSFTQKLLHLQEVANAIKLELKQEIKKTIVTSEQHRLIFFSIAAISILLVLILGIALAHRIISNLNTVLNFLESKNTRDQSLTSQIKGRDELQQFAEKVENLTIERQKNQDELIITKNEAITAKEEAIKASKAKSSFLANMSHEIRTPLNGVIGVSDILASTQLNAIQKDYVDTIETSSQLLLSLINDILDFSKIESGKLPISTYSTNLRESLYDVVAIMAPQLKEKSIELNINIDPYVPLKVLADDHRIRQVLMNLMSNAVKFTEAGSVSINIQCQKEKQDSTSFLFEVIDTGIGINKEQQQKIFEPFSQEDNSTTREFGGTGLGLAISTQLIELMGGKLKLDSQKNKGSRFYFCLPLEVTEQSNQINTFFNNTNIIIVCANVEITKTITQELHFFGINNVEIHESFLNVNSQPESEFQVIIHAVTDRSLSNDEISHLKPYNQQNSALCLVKSFNATHVDFSHAISSLISYPLLGNKLYKALEYCYAMVQSSHKNAFKNDNVLPKKHLEIKNTQQEEVSVEGNVTTLRILLVEDNRINQKVAILFLKKAGYQYVVANNGQEAIDIYSKDHHFDIILMDLMMPIKDGFDASKSIRDYEKIKGLPETPIIAVTASVVNDDIQQCYDVGMNSYIPKPIKPDKLYSEIKNHVKNKI